MTVRELGLGRLPATDDTHIQKYSLTDTTMPVSPTPVVIGVSWYQAFDQPTQDGNGKFWIADPDNLRSGQLGRIRGGHAICLRPPRLKDAVGWWRFYHQGEEGACVGFAVARMMSLLNRYRYDGFAVYHAAQEIDEWPGNSYSGTSVRAGLDVAREQGMPVARAGKTGPFKPGHGIAENRWCRTIEDVVWALSPHDEGRSLLTLGYVPATNSWGEDYPREYFIPLDVLDRLLFRERGDASLVTDRAGAVGMRPSPGLIL